MCKRFDPGFCTIHKDLAILSAGPLKDRACTVFFSSFRTLTCGAHMPAPPRPRHLPLLPPRDCARAHHGRDRRNPHLRAIIAPIAFLPSSYKRTTLPSPFRTHSHLTGATRPSRKPPVVCRSPPPSRSIAACTGSPASPHLVHPSSLSTAHLPDPFSLPLVHQSDAAVFDLLHPPQKQLR